VELSGKRILVIDDETGIRASLSQILRDEGFEVEAVANGEEGLARLAKAQFHLVFLDVWLPGRDGLEILQEIRALHPDPAVVMISGHASVEVAVRATKLGAFDFIEKPLGLEKVTVAVANALRHRRLEARNEALRESLRRRPILIGDCEMMSRLRAQIRAAAPTDGRVIIYGENGTGKELVARTIHAFSLRAEEPFVDVNCAAIPEDLIESELFGHVKGAFTGASESKKGKFQVADGGTLFLDEIGDMSLKTQAKVLRVLQEQRFEPVGGSTTVSVDVRVIAATNKDLQDLIRNGEFREDLYFRLSVLPLRVPPLRERMFDIPDLVHHFLEEFARHYGRSVPAVDAAVFDALQRYPWPGNVRELRNVLERLTIMAPHGRMTVADLPPEFGGDGRNDPSGARFEPGRDASLREARESFEKWFISRKLEEHGNNVTRTARALGVERSHLHRKLKIFGLAADRGGGARAPGGGRPPAGSGSSARGRGGR
jgi:two-component system nitrogen regulation response regulator NtrX